MDLPGTYSLGAYSEDEVIARNFILSGESDVVINVVDATNLGRNLYLTVQLLEMGANVVVALNMFDEARARNIEIHVKRLSELLGVPVIPTVATRNQGVKELLAKALAAARNPSRKVMRVDYGREVEEELERLEKIVASHPSLSKRYSSRWIATKLLEHDARILEDQKHANIEELLSQADKSAKHLTEVIILWNSRQGSRSGHAGRTLRRGGSRPWRCDKATLDAAFGLCFYGNDSDIHPLRCNDQSDPARN